MNNDVKMTQTHMEEKPASSIEDGPKDEQYLDRIATVDIDNYHGIDLKTVLVYLALCILYFVQLFNVVGSGAYSRNIGDTIGGTSEEVWISQAIVITTVVSDALL